MSGHHHVFSFPFDAPSTLRPQDNAIGSSTSSATSSTTLFHVSTSAASSTTDQNFHFASLQETAVEVTSSGSSHQHTHVKSGHPSRSNNASEQEYGSSASTHLDIYSGGQEGRHGRCLSVEPEVPPSYNGSRRGSAQLSRPPIEVKETLNASVTKTAHGKMVGQYVLKRVLGQGAYGIVHLGYNVEDHANFAIKEFSKSKLRKKKGRANLFKLGPGRRRGPAATTDDSNAPLELIRGEIAILKKLNHDNIVKLYEVLDASAEDSMFMVMEWCEKGVLTEVSLSDKPSEIFGDAECRDVFKQMVLGIEYLHEHDIIHRDIKPDNLLRSKDGTLKIVDFGVSKIFNKKGDDSTTQGAGSPAFMAPELGGYDRKHISGRAADVWSMGVTLYCIRYGKLPFRPTTTMNLQTVIQEAEPDLSSEKDPRFKTLMSRLLQKNPSERITIDQLRVDPWLTDNGREELISKEENTQNAVRDVTDDDLEKAFKPINSLLAMVWYFSSYPFSSRCA
ncbi:MAG: kinase-like domain-containing protein [Benniella sp.]|nr:MAG: kinase-like domain-containing protein [Benniella sp.]